MTYNVRIAPKADMGIGPGSKRIISYDALF